MPEYRLVSQEQYDAKLAAMPWRQRWRTRIRLHVLSARRTIWWNVRHPVEAWRQRNVPNW